MGLTLDELDSMVPSKSTRSFSLDDLDAGIPMKGSTPGPLDYLKDLGKSTVQSADLLASTAHGISMFPFAIGAEAIGTVEGLLNPNKTVKETVPKYTKPIEDVTLKPGMISSVFGIEPGIAETGSEALTKGFEFLVPSRQIQENLSQMKELGVNPDVADTLAFLWAKQIELLSFGGYSEIGKVGAQKLGSRIQNISKSRNPKAEYASLLDDIQLDPDYAPLRTALERQQKINEEMGDSTAKTPLEQNQRIINASNNIFKGYDVPTASPPEPPSGGGSPLIRRGEEQIARTNLEAQRAAEQQRGLQAELQKTIPRPIASVVDPVQDFVSRAIKGEKMDSPQDLQLLETRAKEINDSLTRAFEEGRIPEVQKPVFGEPTKVAEEPSSMFKSTEEAIKYGKIATPEQVKMLEELAAVEDSYAKAARTSGDFDTAMKHATNGQLYREAVRGSKGEEAPKLTSTKVLEEKPTMVNNLPELESTPYLYHSTNKTNIESIGKEGLKTSNNGKTAIALAIDENTAKGFNKGDVLLRVKNEEIGTEEAAYPNTKRSWENISPEKLEIKIGDEWKPLTETIPSVPEAKIPEFKTEEFRREKGTLTNDAYDIRQKTSGGKKQDLVFNSAAEAEKALTTTRSLVKARKELQDMGTDLEVIKIGDKYHIAEPLRMTLEEELAFEKALEGAMKEVVEKTKSQERMSQAVKDIDPKVLEKQLQDQALNLKRMMQGEVVDLYDLRDEVARIGDAARYNAESSSTSDLAGQFLDLINKKIEEKVEAAKPKPVEGQGFSIAEDELRKGNDGEPLKVIYSQDGRPFGNPLDAVEVMQSRGIEGVIEETKSGFVIEMREPVKLVTPEMLERVRKSSWEIAKDLLTSEEGSVHLERGGKVGPEKVESVRRLIIDAAKSGKSVLDYAKAIGFNDREAQVLARMAAEVSRRVDLAKEDVGLSEINTGKVVNKGKMVKKYRGVEISRTEIKEGLIKALQGSKDITRKTLVGKASREFQTIPQLAKELVNLNFPVFKEILRNYWQVEKISKLELDNILKGLDEVAGKLSVQNFRRIGMRALWEQKDLRMRLEKEGYKEEMIPKLSPEEQNVLNYMRNELEKIGKDINTMRTRNGLAPLKLLDNYFTAMYAESLANKFGIKKIEGRTEVDPGVIADARLVQFRENPLRFMKRMDPVAFIKSGRVFSPDFDAKFVFKKYMENAIKHKNLTPTIALIKELRQPLMTDKPLISKKTGKVVINKKTGKPVMESFFLRKDRPEIDTALRRWSNTLAGRDVEALLTLSDSPTHRFIERTMGMINRNVVLSMIGFSARTVTVQPLALINTVAMVGKINATKGLIKAFKPGEMKRAVRESDVLLTASSDVNIASAFSRGGMNPVKNIRQQGFRRGSVDSYRKAATFLMQETDRVTRTVTWLMAEEYGKSQGWSKTKTKNYADEIVATTQGTSLPGDISPAQRSVLGKTALTLQTFTISDWNNFYNDIIGVGKAGTKLTPTQRANRIFTYAVLTGISNYVFDELLGIEPANPQPVKAAMDAYEDGDNFFEILQAISYESIEKVPGITAVAKYEGSLGGVSQQTIEDLIKSLKDPLNEDRFNRIPGSLEMAGRLAGAPVNQIKKVKKGLEEESGPLKTILGEKYSERKKRPKKIPIY